MTNTARTTASLAAINLAVYCLLFAAWLLDSLFPSLVSSLTSALALPHALEELTRHPWTLLTYMFVHVGFLHLIVNMLWLIGFGAATGGSGRRIILSYLAGGVAGALLFELLPVQGSLAGASAAVISVVVCGAICFPDRRLNFLFFTEMKARWLAVIAVAIMVLASLSDPAAAVAHAGGATAGVLTGLVCRYRARRHSYVALEKARDNTRRQALIHKTRRSGFASLSEAERRELFNLSARYSS